MKFNQSQRHPCLFADVATCDSSESSEHLIQKSLGGTLESTSVICGVCNPHFGQNLDPGFGAYFSHLIDLLRPLMPAQFHEVTRFAQTTDGDVDLVRRGGGVVELRKIHKEFDANGQLKAISAPAGTPRPELEKIWAALAPPGKTMRHRMVPLSQITESGMTKHAIRFAQAEHRAAAKSILEILDWQTARMGLPPFARSPQLKDARNYVRNGASGRHIGKRSSPMYNLEEEMAAIFSPRRCTFSNRVVVSNDAHANRCVGLIQIANTMPLGLCLGEAVAPESFSFIYEAGLFAGDEDLCERRDGALITWRAFCDGAFVIKSRHSNDFAFLKMREAFDREVGRALVHVDMTCDDNLAEVIRQHSWHAVQESTSTDPTLIRRICEPLLKLRFKRNEIPDAQWECAMAAFSGEIVDLEAFASQVRTTESLGHYGDVLLGAFRSTLQGLVQQHGYPRTTVLLDVVPQ